MSDAITPGLKSSNDFLYHSVFKTKFLTRTYKELNCPVLCPLPFCFFSLRIHVPSLRQQGSPWRFCCTRGLPSGIIFPRPPCSQESLCGEVFPSLYRTMCEIPSHGRYEVPCLPLVFFTPLWAEALEHDLAAGDPVLTMK